MNIKKFAKQATVLTFTTALLAGGATQAFAKETNQKPYKETYGISHITRHDIRKSLNSKKMKNIKCLNSIRPQLKISLLQKYWTFGTAGTITKR
nr:hypothetical protein P5630_09225 [Bacillus subtilis]